MRIGTVAELRRYRVREREGNLGVDVDATGESTVAVGDPLELR